jgi:peptide/nickel transport system substrate-binding protein
MSAVSIRFSAAAVFAALVVAGCVPTTPQAGQPAQQASGPRQMVLAQSTDLTTLEATYFTDQKTNSVAGNVVEGLARRGADFKMQNVLAESITPNATNTVWEVKLRKGVKFHNGDELNAEALKFTVDKIIDPNRKPASIIKSKIDFIQQVDVVDPMTARFTLKNPNPFFRESTANINVVSPKYYAANDEAYLGTHLNGTGPYKLVEWIKGDRVVLEANADYWGGKPKLDKIIYRIIPEASARLAALRAGEVDLIAGVSIDDIDGLKAEKNIVVKDAQLERSIQVGINQVTKEGPLRDIRVRQALNHAVDVDGIVKNLLRGRAERTPTILSKFNFGFAELPLWKYDPQKARELLAAANIPASTEFTFTTSDGNFPKDKEVSQAIVDNLRAVGLNVKLEVFPTAEFINTKNAKKLGDFWIVGWASGSFDGLDNMTWIMRHKATLWGEQYVEDPETDRLMKEAAGTVDLDKRGALLRDVQKVAYDKAYSIFLYSPMEAYALRDRVVGWEVPSDEIMTVGKDTTVK